MCITNKRFLENAEVMLAGKDKIGTEEKELERIFNDSDIWDKVFKNGLSKVCGRQPLRILLGPFLNTLSKYRRTVLRN